MELTSLSLAELQARFRAKEVSPVEALTALEARIAAVDAGAAKPAKPKGAAKTPPIDGAAL